jgi:ankyrin repeat protein
MLDRTTPLHAAASDGTVDVVRLLLEHGASVDEKNKDGRTAFQVVRTDEKKKLLSEYGASNTQSQDYYRHSCLR